MTIYLEFDADGKIVSAYYTEDLARKHFKIGNTLKTQYVMGGPQS